jgi:hypothetical protein
MPTRAYQPIDLYFQPLGDGRYGATIIAPGGLSATGFCSAPAGDEYQALLGQLQRGGIGREKLSRLGAILYGSLFTTEIERVFGEAHRRLAKGDSLRLRLHIDLDSCADLAAAPWEFLCAPSEPLPIVLRDIPIARCIRHGDRAIPAPSHPIRVLLSAAVDVEPRAAAERELAVVQQALAHLGDQVRTTLDTQLTADRLSEHLAGGIDIWHFVGHGGRSGAEGYLCLQDAQRERFDVSATALAALLAPSDLNLVVLDACESGRLAENPLWSIAPALVRDAVPAAVAMQLALSDETARAFAAGFYRALSAGQLVEASVNAGRRSLVVQSRSLQPDWGIPIVYTRSSLESGPLAAPSGERVARGFDALSQILGDPDAYAVAAAVASRGTMREVRRQLADLTEYKNLHDLLHQLADAYALIADDAAGLAEQERRWFKLARNEPAVYGLAGAILELALRANTLRGQIGRITRLDRARATLRGAVAARDPARVSSALELFQSVLEVEPGRINDRLVELARVLPLRRLADDLLEIWQRRPQRASAELGRRFAEFRQGLDELSRLGASLDNLIEAHRQLQDLEIEIQRFDSDLTSDPARFQQQLASAWEDYLREQSQQACAIASLHNRAELSEAGAVMDSALPGRDAYVISTAFARYRALLNQIFSRTDADILTICNRDLADIGQKIDLMLGLIA